MISTKNEIPFGSELLLLSDDSAGTDRIFEVFGRIQKQSHYIQPMVERALSDQGFCDLFQSHYVPAPFEISALAELPEETLGYHYARHILDNGLKVDFYPSVSGKEASDYLVLRLRQTHDIWHSLLGYSISPMDEFGLLAFGIAQLGSVNSAVLVAYGILRIAHDAPEQVSELMERITEGYSRGQTASFLPGIPWEIYWKTPIAEVRRRFGIEPHRRQGPQGTSTKQIMN